MTYLLDTNICIYIIKQKPQIVFDKFKKIALGNIGISSVSVAELYFGVMKSASIERNSSALEQFLLPLEILDFDTLAAIEYGKIRATLEKKGTPIGSLDMLIAAHAKSQELIVVTNNEKEFNRVEGLKIENWTIE